jgi:hypothetical protein
MKASILIDIISLAVFTANAETLTFNTPAGWEGMEASLQKDDGVLEIPKQRGFIAKQKIEINPVCSYRFSLKLRAAPDTPPAPFLIGFRVYDRNGNEIIINQVNVVAGTDTELAAPLKVGDLVIKIKDGARWIGKANFFAVFQTDPSYKDLPNPNVMQIPLTQVKKIGDDWEITLASPSTNDYPAGTKVRQHAGGGWMNCAQNTSDAEWKECSGSTKGIDTRLVYPSWKFTGKWWPGTVSAKPFIMVNWDAKIKNASTQLKDIQLEIIKEEGAEK